MTRRNALKKPEHKRVCVKVAEKPVRALNAGQEAVRQGVLQLQAAKTQASCMRTTRWDWHTCLGYADH
jgi:hypothetical protein